MKSWIISPPDGRWVPKIVAETEDEAIAAAKKYLGLSMTDDLPEDTMVTDLWKGITVKYLANMLRENLVSE